MKARATSPLSAPAAPGRWATLPLAGRLARFPAAVALVGAIAFAACGSSGTSSGATKQPAPSSRPAASASGPTVGVASNTKFGDILVDANGMTLYTFTNNGKPVTCTGACAAAWPPLFAPNGGQPTGATGVTGLGTTPGNGSTLVTESGLPLYRFSGDAAAGDANGDGLNSFGGIWHVVKTSAPVSGGGATSAPATTPSTNASNMSGGSGGASSGY